MLSDSDMHQKLMSIAYSFAGMSCARLNQLIARCVVTLAPTIEIIQVDFVKLSQEFFNSVVRMRSGGPIYEGQLRLVAGEVLQGVNMYESIARHGMVSGITDVQVEGYAFSPINPK